MLYFVFQSILFQLIFLLAYDLFLKNDTFFNYNRMYLLITSILSLVIPFIKIESFNQVLTNNYIVSLPEVVLGNINQTLTINQTVINGINTTDQSVLTITNIYFLITVSVLVFFLIKLFKILKLIVQNPKTKKHKLILVQLKDSTLAFSFFSFVFLGDKLTKTETQAIIEHERIHAQQKHTLDLLWFEVLKIVFWFNPLIYLYQNRISNLHEFLADRKAIKINKSEYYQQLLQQVFSVKTCSFINPFFKQSLIKKRIIMLQKSKSKQVNLTKYLLLIPMIFGMVIYTSCVDADSNLNQIATANSTADLPELVTEVKNQIAKQGNVSKDEEEVLSLLLATVKSNEFNPDLVKKITQLTAKKNKSILEQKLASVFRKIQEKGNISETDDQALKDLLILTSKNGFDDPMFKEALDRVEIPFGVVNQAPVFPGCEELTGEAQKKCFATKMSNHVLSNFNTKLADNLDIEKGLQRIMVQFKINKEGGVTILKVKAPHIDLETEAKRVINTLPKISPGSHEGKVVDVVYALPIAFQIN